MSHGDAKITSGDHHGCHWKKNRGPSSFRMQEPGRVFEGLGLAMGHRFLDLGCGPGDYSLAAAKIVGPTGFVCAIDIWKDMAKNLSEEIRSRGMANIRTMVADIIAGLPFPDNVMDRALLAAVLHMPGPTRNLLPIGAEVRRVIKPGGRLAILERHVREIPPDRPVHLHLSPERLEEQMAQVGFRKAGRVELGPNYLLLFK